MREDKVEDLTRACQIVEEEDTFIKAEKILQINFQSCLHPHCNWLNRLVNLATIDQEMKKKHTSSPKRESFNWFHDPEL